MNIHYFQHVSFETLGSIEPWVHSHHHRLSGTRFYQGESLPNLEEIDWLIVMGGPMNIYEEKTYPWLTQEKKFIEQAIKAGKGVIGVCLGAQLIADVFGASVIKNLDKEIGWFPVEFMQEAKDSPWLNVLPQKLEVFHWHGDTFTLPKGAIHIAQSKGCIQQGFIYHEKVLALQFHLEVQADNIQKLIKHCGDELQSGKYIQTPNEMLGKEEGFKRAQEVMVALLNKLPT
ncbi:type 1 glutamine amidotransferase [Candidatus Nitrosacidococcus tergens]|uniref:Glutamine amidotransferase class-I n=1 Tax=Candidatus Nitrosacidococcus tergens TaxID=553981 RepID=A0A7G1Q786_9GAMM|nr:type 1 glutamine amidotransferase [Candidatus Nitrosacidococcus tergens]CAB1274353.1 Glutamine amidotransferase class-I [Candidatus Nitrosacidococcus tergens]